MGAAETIFFPAWVLFVSKAKESFIWDTDWDKHYVILRQSTADVFILISNWVIVAHEEESPT